VLGLMLVKLSVAVVFFNPKLAYDAVVYALACRPMLLSENVFIR
jgi:hypothetical protein